jgi:hypothetical protein
VRDVSHSRCDETGDRGGHAGRRCSLMSTR